MERAERRDESFYQRAVIETLVYHKSKFLTFDSLGFSGVTPDVIVIDKGTLKENFKNHEVFVLEVKRKLSYEYLGQLLRYKKLFGVVYLVIPLEEVTSPSTFYYIKEFEYMLKRLGIGLVLVSVKEILKNGKKKYFVEFEEEVDVRSLFASELLTKHFAYLYSLKKILDITLDDKEYINLYNLFRNFVKKKLDIKVFYRNELIDSVYRNIFCPLKPSLELNGILVGISENPLRYMLINPYRLIEYDLKELIGFFLENNPLSEVIESSISRIEKYSIQENILKLTPSLILYLKYTKPYINYDRIIEILKKSVLSRYIRLKSSLCKKIKSRELV